MERNNWRANVANIVTKLGGTPTSNWRADIRTIKELIGQGGGGGTVKSVDNVMPDANGNVLLDIDGKLMDKADLIGGKIPASQLPAGIDSILEFNTVQDFPSTGASNVIYLALDTNKVYRWSGTQYTVVSETIALGETSSTAFRGDLGKIAYQHVSQTGNPHNTSAAEVGLDNVDNTSDLQKPTSEQQQLSIDAAVHDLKQGTGNFIVRFQRTGLTQTVANGATYNLMTSMALNAPTMIASYNIPASSLWNLTSGVLKLHATATDPAKTKYTSYSIAVRITAAISGVVDSAKMFTVGLVRPNGTVLASNEILNMDSGPQYPYVSNFETYTFDVTDPFIVDGLTLILNNTTGSTITISAIDILIKGINL